MAQHELAGLKRRLVASATTARGWLVEQQLSSGVKPS
jgi:hypothetical protein